MPKVVDHEQRRRELGHAVWRVIRRDGVERASVRAVAEEVVQDAFVEGEARVHGAAPGLEEFDLAGLHVTAQSRETERVIGHVRDADRAVPRSW